MIVSTRGRYALRVMIDLAENSTGEFIPMKDVAQRQSISLKYLERILPVLSKNNLIEGVHGKGGGYRLTRLPQDYKVGEILRLTEGNLAPVACLEANTPQCEKTHKCRTLPMWKGLHTLVNSYFDSISIADLLNGNINVPEI